MKNEFKNKKSIFFIIGQLDIGGAETHLLNILPELKALNYKVKLFPLSTGGQLEEEFKNAGVDIYSNNETTSGFIAKVKRVFALCIILRRKQPDIIHYFLPEAYLVGTCCSIFSAKSLRVMSRRSLNVYQKKKPILKQLEYFFHRFMHLVLGNSKAVIAELLQEGIEKEKVKLIYNGISLAEKNNEVIKSKTRKKLGVPEDILLITIVSNLIPYKGHKDLFYALKKVERKLPEKWLLLCIGRDDGYAEELSELVEEFNMNEKIKFIGHSRDTTDFFSAADIGILSSHQEGFSNSLLEGMAHGLPMVATDVGGNAEAIIDGENGFIVAAQNPDQLGEKILNLAENKALRIQLGNAAHATVRKNFTIEHCAKQYINMYDALLTELRS